LTNAGESSAERNDWRKLKIVTLKPDLLGCANRFRHSVGGRPVKIPVVAVRQTT
jgi:hypothetical protein